MSALKTTVRGLAAAGLAAGLVAGAAAPAAADITSVTYDFDVVTDSAVEAGSVIPAQVVSNVSWMTDDNSSPSDEKITLTPDDSSALVFAAMPDDPRCTDVGDGSVECSEPGPYPEEGEAYLVSVGISPEATAESDLGFTATGSVAEVDPSSKHYTFTLGESAAVEDEEPEEPTEEPSDPTEEPTDDGEPKPDEGGEETTDDETLPTTGADSTLLIAGAAAALVVGAGAIFLVRRRKLANDWE